MYQQSQPESIQTMFATIAKNYDKTNRLMSLGLYQRWNRALLREIGSAKTLLDLCAGTGDISLAFLKKHPTSQAILLDFCPEMLQIAEQKGKPYAHQFHTVVADAQKIPLSDGSVDAVTISYGIRNVKNPLLAFQECYRVLQPGGVLGILELTRPSNPLLHLGHSLYLRTCLPLIGKLGSNNKKAYSYLASSISKFASPYQLSLQLEQVGFENVRKISLMGGASTILLAHKKQ